MIHPAKSVVVASRGLALADFETDAPFPHAAAKPEAIAAEGTIEGVTVSSLIPHSDARGSLCELLTTRDGRIEPIVHVYQVTALSGSIRHGSIIAGNMTGLLSQTAIFGSFSMTSAQTARPSTCSTSFISAASSPASCVSR